MTSGIQIRGQRGAVLSAAVGIPVSVDGTVGRKCPSCRRFFKVEVQRLAAIEELTCPYCGNGAPRDAFLTMDQRRRIMSAVARLAVDHAAAMLDETWARSTARPGLYGSNSNAAVPSFLLF